MQTTPNSNRTHIIFLGSTNAGKSSLLNAVTEQEISIVSDIKGTTTDSVKKAMELIPFGPVLFIDTAGFNDNSELGKLRIEKTIKEIKKSDFAIYVIDGNDFNKKIYLLPVKNIVYKGNDPEVDSYSGFFDNNKVHKTKLDEILKENNIDTLYILGLATDYCVKFTVLDALSLGYKVYLVSDGCKGVNINPDDSEKAVEEMKNAGAVIIKSCEIL